jgi:hypothetical protein
MLMNMVNMEIFPVLGYLMLMYKIGCSKGKMGDELITEIMNF